MVVRWCQVFAELEISIFRKLCHAGRGDVSRTRFFGPGKFGAEVSVGGGRGSTDLSMS